MTLPTDLQGERIGALMESYPFISQFFNDEGVDDFIDDPEWTLGRSLEQHVRSNGRRS